MTRKISFVLTTILLLLHNEESLASLILGSVVDEHEISYRLDEVLL